MEQDILETFKNIPSGKILEMAHSIQNAIRSDSTLVKQKDKNEFVTEADLKIQKFLLDYFENSPLAGKYNIKAEEELSPKESELNNKSKPWQLLIDPIDGTTPFSKGENTWGTMVGLCDYKGKLIYSWNLLSNGEIFHSASANKITSHDLNNSSFRIDVDNYGNGATEIFPTKFEAFSLGKYRQEKIIVSAYPAAIWTGWELYSGKLDALLWLPSSKSKGFYPDYDLIFLGALYEQGWKIALGKHAGEVQMVVVAATSEELRLLWLTGLELIDKTALPEITYLTDLMITSAFINR